MEHKKHQKHLNLEFCVECQAVHFRTTNVLINFSKQEFTELAESVLKIYYFDSGWGNVENGETVTEDVLLSEVIG